MLCIGVDFGSTYTTVSVYQEETGKLEAQTLSEGGTPFIPSVVSVSKGQISVGREAKMMSMMGKKGIQNFRAFKMMLAEENEEVLTDRGFTATYTPEHVTADFLENILKQVLDNIGETKIDHLVLGVPEIWNSTLTTIDGRSRLRDICRRFSFVEKSGVQVVSEPAAASAFFAYNFRQMVGDNFDGKILLVDYGGGTLDITLNEVDVRPDKNGQEGMEIRILYRTGAGENEQRQIGKASIVYMESLLESAIHQEFPNMKIEHDVHFYRALDGLEVQLQECTNIIKTIFDDYGTDPEDLSEDEMDEEDYIFTMIPYRGMFINISYQLMVQVYDQIIRGVFDEKMEEVIQYMKERNIDYMNRNDQTFKIVLVGGFGNYYLVKKQMTDKFKFSSTDERQKNIIMKREDCEKAISLGAALLASNVLRIRNTAPYSIGIRVRDEERISLTYGLRYNQDIEFNKIYMQNDVYGNPVVMVSLTGDINAFIINLRDDDRYAMEMYPKEAIRKRLKQAITNTDGTAVVGFSLDSSGVISIHVYDYDIFTGKFGTKGNVIELTNFRELFDMQTVKKVYKE
ncbi:MAG: Hsp70 family protein [Lachnospiraceae bacterium]|nr:Hsp70 family protein [Lachnospiraceae bacterium]